MILDNAAIPSVQLNSGLNLILADINVGISIKYWAF
jgi:hypothetical protein